MGRETEMGASGKTRDEEWKRIFFLVVEGEESSLVLKLSLVI